MNYDCLIEMHPNFRGIVKNRINDLFYLIVKDDYSGRYLGVGYNIVKNAFKDAKRHSISTYASVVLECSSGPDIYLNEANFPTS